MKAMQNIPPVERTYASIGKQSTLFYVLATGTGLLLVWLSVGLTPSTWWLLFQVISQFRTLWTQYGINTIWTLLLLLGQSLLLLAAWVLLIGIVVRESTRFQTLQPASSQPTYMHSARLEPASPQSTNSPSTGAATVLAPPPPPPAKPVRDQIQTAFVPGQAYIDQTKEHTAPPASQRPLIDEQPLGISPEPVRERPQPLPAQAAHITEMPTQIAPPSPPDAQQSPDPYVAPRIFRQGEQVPFPDPEELLETLPTQRIPPELQAHLQRPKWQSDDLSSDPFAPYEDILARSLQENPLSSAEDRPEQTPPAELVKPAQPVPASEGDGIFVFGNPFEGALPDVFEHDEDLKRSLKEQNSELHPALDDTAKFRRAKRQQ